MYLKRSLASKIFTRHAKILSFNATMRVASGVYNTSLKLREDALVCCVCLVSMEIDWSSRDAPLKLNKTRWQATLLVIHWNALG